MTKTVGFCLGAWQRLLMIPALFAPSDTSLQLHSHQLYCKMGALLSIPLMAVPSVGTVCYPCLRPLPLRSLTDSFSSLRWRPLAAVLRLVRHSVMPAESSKAGKYPCFMDYHVASVLTR